MRLLYLTLTVLCVLTYGRNAEAFGGSAQEKRQLAFGSFWVKSSAQQNLEIATDGTVTADPGIVVLKKGMYGVYRLYNYTPGLAVTLTIDDSTLDRVMGGTPSFDIVDFTFDPSGAGQVMDGSGELEVKIGATLQTRPSTTYLAGAYRGTYTLMINF